MALQLGRPARPLPRRARRAAGPHAGHPGHHELHGLLQAGGLLVVRGGGGRRRQRLVPGAGRPPLPRQDGAHPHNLPKPPGQLRLESLQAVARGADGLCYFQWRASRFGAERFHAAMVPHAGADTRLHAEVRAHGQELRGLAALAGEPVPARVAMVFGWENWWALEERGRPSDRLNAVDQLLAYYVPFFERGVSVDVVPPSADLSSYALVVVPNLFLVTDEDAGPLSADVRGDAVLVVGPFSGVVDPRGHVRTGPFPALLREVLGAGGEEWLPAPDDRPVRCRWSGGAEFAASTWTELLRAEGAEAVAEFADGD
ncbi:beta-galactosidase, partial [Nonomuraea maheshkhaliensis]|uniref:beta-galactosidase n=1 Tax=Nonomuraea maheshkhaliensis TaxID=419590 RepID=UPI0031FA026F